jgi:hypothetical protein
MVRIIGCAIVPVARPAKGTRRLNQWFLREIIGSMHYYQRKKIYESTEIFNPRHSSSLGRKRVVGLRLLLADLGRSLYGSNRPEADAGEYAIEVID